jgi:hypothetical protein
MKTTPIKDEPLRLHEVAFATAIVVVACASVAVGFAAIATCQYAGDTIKRIRLRGGRRHVPR